MGQEKSEVDRQTIPFLKDTATCLAPREGWGDGKGRGGLKTRTFVVSERRRPLPRARHDLEAVFGYMWNETAAGENVRSWQASPQSSFSLL